MKTALRWCLVVAIGVVSCGREELFKIEYGPPVAVVATLAHGTMRAGGRASVTCELKAAKGNEVRDPDIYLTYVEEVDGLELTGYTLTGTSPGEYEIRCGVVAMPDIERIPDVLTVRPDDPRSIDLRVDPERRFHEVGDVVTLELVIEDEYGNLVPDLFDSVEWSIPSDGLAQLDGAPGRRPLRFEADGIFRVSASLGAPWGLETPARVLVCDSAPPTIILTSPKRGEMLDDEAIVVSGTVRDGVSGVETLEVNGVEVAIADDGSFTTELSPTHGLNHVSVVAMDRAGHRARASSSVYHSRAWRAFEDTFESSLAEGLGVHLGQTAIDAGTRDCGKNEEGAYLCSAYEDMATMAEVLLNNLDLTELAAGRVYEYGPIQIAEENLGSASANVPAAPPVLNNRHRIHGSFILRGEYLISINVTSVEQGHVVMGDRNSGVLGLRAVPGGLDLLAFVRPDRDSDAGLRLHMEVRFDVDLRVFFTVDTEHDPDNGVWNRDSGANVTSSACGDLGAFRLIDTVFDSDLRGYVCRQKPLARSDPHAFTGSSANFEAIRIAGHLSFDTTEDGLLDVTLTSPPGAPLIDFLGHSVTMESDEDIVVDLGTVEIIGGVFTVNLGSFTLGNPAKLLDPIVSTLMTELQVLLAFLLEDLIVCEGSLSGCPLDVRGLIEEVFNSLARRDHVMRWPPVMPLGTELSVLLSQYFSSVSFGFDGARMGFDVTLTTERGLHASIPEPRGTLLRGPCLGNGALAALPSSPRMAAGFDLDLVNQALMAGWYNGGLNGPLAPEAPGGAIDALAIELYPLLPPVMTACTGQPDQLELHLGSARVVLELVIEGRPVDAMAFSDLALLVYPSRGEDGLDLVVGEPVLNELEILAADADLGDHLEAIRDLIAHELMPDLLARFGKTVVSGIPVPTIELTNAALPGLDLDIEVEFPVTETRHESAVIVAISD